MKQKTAFITGVTGQDGSILSDILLNKGYKVIGLRRRSSTFNTERVEHIYKNPNFIMEWGNMTDVYSLYNIIKKHNPDEIYNLAAQSHVNVSFKVPEETLDTVAKGTLHLLNIIKEHSPKTKFYQASSSEMYGITPCPDDGYDEKSRFTPASPYACAKVFAHNLCRNYRESYKLHISCGILFNHEQPGLRGETFVTRKRAQAAARIKLGKQDKLYLGNLDAKRDWGYAKDYCYAQYLMLQQEEPDDYVIATGETHSVKEFLEEVFNHASLSIDDHVEIDPKYFRPEEVPVLLGNSTKAKEKLGWKPQVGFSELAKLMYEVDLNKEQNK